MTCEVGVMPVEERGPSSRSTQDVVKGQEIGSMILEPPDSVQKLQAALHPTLTPARYMDTISRGKTAT
jgi:hypothetical protein